NASIGTSNLQARDPNAEYRVPLRFNASIGTSNLQAQDGSARVQIAGRFQCLNRHEQPSSQKRIPQGVWRNERFNASIGTSNLQAWPHAVAPDSEPCFNASIGTSNLQASSRVDPSKRICNVSMPQSARATFKQLQAERYHTGSWGFQCLNRHEQPSSHSHRHEQYARTNVSMPQSARATFKPRCRWRLSD